MGMTLATGVEMIAREREEQLAVRGFDAAHDDKHVEGELAQAAAFYAHPKGGVIFPETWDPKWNKRDKHRRIRQLAIAGALCAAEIDRLRRKG
jgi:hypothetical protein